MKGGEFFRFNFGLWHSFTTLSMSFHVFSMDFLLISNLRINVSINSYHGAGVRMKTEIPV